jgi:hypothetical protein
VLIYRWLSHPEVAVNGLLTNVPVALCEPSVSDIEEPCTTGTTSLFLTFLTSRRAFRINGETWASVSSLSVVHSNACPGLIQTAWDRWSQHGGAGQQMGDVLRIDMGTGKRPPC